MSSIYSKFYNQFLKFKSVINKEPYFPYYKKYKKEQWLAPEELDRIRLERLNRLLNHAKKNSAYYRNILSDEHLNLLTLSDITKLPVLTRDNIQNYSEKILA